MESIGNLYDYPRESIERRKLLRRLRRSGLQNGFTLPEAEGDNASVRQTEPFHSLPDIETEPAKFEEKSLMTAA